jgi:hypothetical protein
MDGWMDDKLKKLMAYLDWFQNLPPQIKTSPHAIVEFLFIFSGQDLVSCKNQNRLSKRCAPTIGRVVLG